MDWLFGTKDAHRGLVLISAGLAFLLAGSVNKVYDEYAARADAAVASLVKSAAPEKFHRFTV